MQAAIQFFDLCYTKAASAAQVAILEKKGVFVESWDGVRPCNYTWDGHLNDTEYKLEFTFKPAEWIDLMNYFELRGEVYMVFYTIIGLLSVLQAGTIWVLNRLLTRLRHPPPFHAQTMLAIITEAPLIGVSLAAVPLAMGTFFIFGWLKSYANFGFFASVDPEQDPSAMNLEGVDGNYGDSMGLSASQIYNYAYGRTGVCFVAAGLYLNFFCCTLIVPNWKADEEEAMAALPEDKKKV